MNSDVRFMVEERIRMLLLFLVIALLYIIFTPIRFVLRYTKPGLFENRAMTNLYSLLKYSNI